MQTICNLVTKYYGREINPNQITVQAGVFDGMYRTIDRFDREFI